MKRISKKFKEDQDTGFSAKASIQGGRLLNANGSFNVIRKGLPFVSRLNFFHELIMMKWSKFIFVVLAFYTAMNMFFGVLYYLVGVEYLNGSAGNSELDKFLESFFFSTQTFATVGYGRINPIGIITNIIASLEALMGVMSLAVVTSLLYSRFSRAQAKMVYSKNMLIAPYQNITALMFRIANVGKDQLIECEIQFMVSFVVNENGSSSRKFLPLKLERSKVASIPSSWTIVHPLDEESPLLNFSQDDLAEAEAEFLFMFKAFDDTYSQTIHTRSSYAYNDIIWGAKFLPMFHPSEDGNSTVIEFDKINLHESAELPLRLQKASSE